MRPLRRLACRLALAAATTSAFAAAPPLVELSAADVASAAAGKGPAIVVLWSPECLACRKSLNEIERFVATARERGIAVTTVVPADAYDDARALAAERGLSLKVQTDAKRLEAPSRRVLLDRPLAYAIDGRGEVVGARAGLLGAWNLEDLAADATRPAE